MHLRSVGRKKVADLDEGDWIYCGGMNPSWLEVAEVMAGVTIRIQLRCGWVAEYPRTAVVDVCREEMD